MIDLYQEILTKALIPTQDQAAATVTGTGVLCTGYPGWAKVTLDSAAMSTGDTLDLTLEESDLLGSAYTGLTVYDKPNGTATPFTQVTDAAVSRQERYINLDGAKKYVRGVGTLAGTTILASFNVAMVVRAKRLPGS